MKEYTTRKDHYYNVIKDNTVIKLFCKRLQLKGNCFSIKKRLFRKLHFKFFINFELLLTNNILKIFSTILKELISPESDIINLNIFNMRNFVSVILAIFRVVHKYFIYSKGTVDLNDYLLYDFNKLNRLLLNGTNYNNLLSRIFFKNYFKYISKFCNSYYGFNFNFFNRKRFFIRKVYKYRFINRCLVNSYCNNF